MGFGCAVAVKAIEGYAHFVSRSTHSSLDGSLIYSAANFSYIELDNLYLNSCLKVKLFAAFLPLPQLDRHS